MEEERQEREKCGTKTLGVLLTYPIDPYLESELSSRFTLYHLPQNSYSYPLAFSSSIRAVVCNTIVGANASLIDALPILEIVTTFSIGLDKVDMYKCRERGISVTNTPDVLTEDVADLAIGLAVAVLRRICLADEWVRKGDWGRKREFPLAKKFSGSSVGIVGMGRIGTAIANRAEAFGCTISYHSRSRKPNLNYSHFDTIAELAANCGILFVACPLTEETYHIINHNVIEALGPEGVLINIGRGSIVDEDELVSALVEGRLGGAGLDVFEHEPEPHEKLFGLKNVVLLPHVGSSTYETCKAMTDLVIANLEAHVLGKPLLTPVL